MAAKDVVKTTRWRSKWASVDDFSDFDCGEQTSESVLLLPSFLTNFLTYLITYPLCPGWDLRPQESI